MKQTYRAAVIGCNRMGGFIDNEVVGRPNHVPPYSHGAGFYACERTELVACSDLRVDVMAQFGELYEVPAKAHYVDYREMIAKEQLDIVSVATQPEIRAQIVIHAAEHGVKAIYAEKAMAASLAEADAMVEAVERNNVAFNLGTNRRWDTRYQRMKEMISSRQLGELKTLIAYETGQMFNMASHTFDLIMYLNDDQPATWVQAYVPDVDDAIDGDALRADPGGQGMIKFANGVFAHMLRTARGYEFEAIGENGTVTGYDIASQGQVRQYDPNDSGRWRTLVPAPFPKCVQASTTLRLIEDLVHALDTGGRTLGGVRVALAGMELIFGFIESHQRGGMRVRMPLEKRTLRLQRDRPPRQPKYKP